jgi:hypothetical protein
VRPDGSLCPARRATPRGLEDEVHVVALRKKQCAPKEPKADRRRRALALPRIGNQRLWDKLLTRGTLQGLLEWQITRTDG